MHLSRLQGTIQKDNYYYLIMQLLLRYLIACVLYVEAFWLFHSTSDSLIKM